MSERDVSALSASVFDEIDAALASTARGRAYLREAARRARSDEGRLLLDAVARLDRRLTQGWSEPDWAQLRADFATIEARVQATRRVLLGGRSEGRNAEGATALVEENHAVAKAVSDSTGRLEEIAWSMREAGFDFRLCDRLDEEAGLLVGTSSRHERIGAALHRLAETLADAEATIRAVAKAPGGQPRPLPPLSPDVPPKPLTSGDLAFVPEGGPKGADAHACASHEVVPA